MEQDVERILAICTCHNRREKTIKCIESLINGNSTPFHFIVVDDGSTDGTKEALKTLKNIDVINGSGDLYYSKGMSKGMEYAKRHLKGEYKYVMLLNDDVCFFEGSIDSLTKFAKDDRQIIIGATCDEQRKLTYGGGIKKSRFFPAFDIVMSGTQIIECDTFNANCVLVPFDIFLKEESIDCRFSHSLGDYDYGLRLSGAGYVLVVSDFFVGRCNDNPRRGTWMDSSLPIKRRIELKESPKGLPTKDWFYFVKRYYGFFSACISVVKPYIRIMIKR